MYKMYCEGNAAWSVVAFREHDSKTLIRGGAEHRAAEICEEKKEEGVVSSRLTFIRPVGLKLDTVSGKKSNQGGTKVLFRNKNKEFHVIQSFLKLSLDFLQLDPVFERSKRASIL